VSISSPVPKSPASVPPAPTAAAAPVSRSSFWRVFASTFITIFLAELGDKTQVTTLLMSAQSQSPLVVFLGAGTALITTSLIGVLLGRWLARRISPATLDTAAGAMLLAITVSLLWDVAHL
jgi:Ca2+/H+ antiporter, TMEM165/GDT1 family